MDRRKDDAMTYNPNLNPMDQELDRLLDISREQRLALDDLERAKRAQQAAE